MVISINYTLEVNPSIRPTKLLENILMQKGSNECALTSGQGLIESLKVYKQLFYVKQIRILLNIGLIRMNILMLDTRNVEQTKDVRMYT